MAKRAVAYCIERLRGLGLEAPSPEMFRLAKFDDPAPAASLRRLLRDLLAVAEAGRLGLAPRPHPPPPPAASLTAERRSEPGLTAAHVSSLAAEVLDVDALASAAAEWGCPAELVAPEAGSRGLLLAVGWALAETRAFEHSVRAAVRIDAGGASVEYTGARDTADVARAGSRSEAWAPMPWPCRQGDAIAAVGEARMALRKLRSAHEEAIRSRMKFEEGSPVTVLEAHLLRNPKLRTEFVRGAQAAAAAAAAVRAEREEHEPVFWEWLETESGVADVLKPRPLYAPERRREAASVLRRCAAESKAKLAALTQQNEELFQMLLAKAPRLLLVR